MKGIRLMLLALLLLLGSCRCRINRVPTPRGSTVRSIDMTETIPCDDTTLKANFPRDIEIFENLFDDILKAIQSNADSMGRFQPQDPLFHSTNLTSVGCSDATCRFVSDGVTRLTYCPTSAGTNLPDAGIDVLLKKFSAGPFGMQQLYNRFQDSAVFFHALLGKAPYIEVYLPANVNGDSYCSQPANLRNPASLTDTSIPWLFQSTIDGQSSYLVPPETDASGRQIVRACSTISDFDVKGARKTRNGVLCGGFQLKKLSENLVSRKPSSNGNFILVSASDWTILDGRPDIMKLICGEAATCKLTDHAQFSTIAANISNSVFSNIHITVDDLDYLVESSEKIRGIFFGIAIVPLTDFTVGASWSVEPLKLEFPFNSGDIQSKNTLLIRNTGLLPLEFSLDVASSTVFKVDQITGTIQPKENQTIEFRACVKDDCTHHPIVITNIHPQFSMCYSPITIQTAKALMDCNLNDMEVKFLPCSGLYHPIRFEYKEPKVCYGGRSPPPPQREFCEVVSHSPIITISILANLAIASFSSFMIVVLALRQRRFTSLVLRTRSTFLYPVAIGLLFYGIGKFLLLFSNTPFPCVLSWVLSQVGFSILAGGLMASCDFIIKEQIKKELILEKEIIFLAKRLGPIAVVHLIIAFATTSNSEMVTYHFTYHSVFKATIRTCGRELIMDAVASIVPVLSCIFRLLQLLLLIYIMSEGINVLRSKCDPAYKRFNKGIVIMSATLFIYILLTSFSIVPSYNGLVVMILQLISPVTSIISLWLMFPFNVWSKSGETLADQTAKTYGAILSDPITRTSLLAHMKDLVQDESLYFFEDVQKFQSICAEMDQPTMKPYAKKIIDAYIREGSDQEINIDVTMRNEVISSFDKNCSLHLFDRAFNEITRLICHNCVSSFLVTPYAAQAKMIRDWFDGFEDFSIQFKRAVRRKILDFPIEGDSSGADKDKACNSSTNANKLGLNFEKAASHCSVFTQDEQEEAALKKKLRGSTTLTRMESVQQIQPVVKSVSNPAAGAQ